MQLLPSRLPPRTRIAACKKRWRSRTAYRAPGDRAALGYMKPTRRLAALQRRFPAQAGRQCVNIARGTPRFSSLTGLYEPSAIQQLPDGRFLVVEDEKDHPFSGGHDRRGWACRKHQPDAGPASILRRLLEARRPRRACARPGWFSCTPSLRIPGTTAVTRKNPASGWFASASRVGRVVDPKVVGNLKDALTAQHPVLASAAGVGMSRPMAGSISKRWRSARTRNDCWWAFAAVAQRPRDHRERRESSGIFEADGHPRSPAISTSWTWTVKASAGWPTFPRSATTSSSAAQVSRGAGPFGLWRWNGSRGAPARRVTVPGPLNSGTRRGSQPGAHRRGGTHRPGARRRRPEVRTTRQLPSVGPRSSCESRPEGPGDSNTTPTATSRNVLAAQALPPGLSPQFGVGQVASMRISAPD